MEDADKRAQRGEEDAIRYFLARTAQNDPHDWAALELSLEVSAGNWPEDLLKQVLALGDCHYAVSSQH